jgi:hypothetical protein
MRSDCVNGSNVSSLRNQLEIILISRTARHFESAQSKQCKSEIVGHLWHFFCAFLSLSSQLCTIFLTRAAKHAHPLHPTCR